jgi:hypothetical protein
MRWQQRTIKTSENLPTDGGTDTRKIEGTTTSGKSPAAAVGQVAAAVGQVAVRGVIRIGGTAEKGMLPVTDHGGRDEAGNSTTPSARSS